VNSLPHPAERSECPCQAMDQELRAGECARSIAIVLNALHQITHPSYFQKGSERALHLNDGFEMVASHQPFHCTKEFWSLDLP
jgi:hypothetical protein